MADPTLKTAAHLLWFHKALQFPWAQTHVPSPPHPSCLPKRKGPDSSSLITMMQEFIFQGAGGTRPRCSLRGLLGFTGNLDRVKEGNDNAPGPLAVELSHRGAKLVTLHWGREGCAWRGCETAWVQRGSVSRLKTLPVPACIFLSSRGRQHSSAARELLCLSPSPAHKFKIR